MKVIDHLRNAKRPLFSIEIIPPLKGKSINSIYQAIDPLLEFQPSFIDVTYHREEYVYRKKPNGLLEKKSIKKRPGTVGICSAIMNKYKIDAVPHIICGGFTCDETEDALIDLSFLGIDNVLVLRGDSIKTESQFTPEPNGNAYASDLLQQIVNMNRGKFMDDELLDAVPTNFCVGVAGYPEKHFESPNMKNDIKYLKMKVDLGADYIVTQMFFDNSKFFKFVDECRAAGITVPIIPGLKVLTTKKQLTLLPSIFHIDMPDDLADAVEKAKDNEQVKEIGIEWCINQCKELFKHNVPCLHFYTMGTSEVCRRVAEKVY